MKKQPEMTDKTRNTIVEAFCEMYEEMPIEKIYVKDVIERAGYNRSTFYKCIFRPLRAHCTVF